VPRVPVAERRRLLVAAAARVMAREGIAHTTTRAITAEAGMPRGSFHYCFRSKEELLRELITAVVSDMAAAIRGAPAGGGDLLQTLRAGLHALWRTVTEHPDEQLVLYELTTYALRDPATAKLAEWQYETYFQYARDYLDFLARQGGISWSLPVPTLARLLVTVVDGLSLNWLPDRDTTAALAVLDAFAAYLASLATAAG
jgi:AcrR family transcriptional regulator